MADLYCDHGAYGAYAPVPTWGTAQDGDGTAKTLGTPSTAEVVFTGIASTGVIAVLGQTITFTRVTSADVCANNLATAINASTAVATGPDSFTTKSQVRNHLFARGPSTGAPAGTCQIMTRQASASHAGLIAVTHTLNNVSSPATILFAGGTGGVLGQFGNHENLWPQALVPTSYGAFCTIFSFTGFPSPGDRVKVRSGKTIVYPTSTASMDLILANMGTMTNPVIFEIDDGTEWPADGVTPVLRLERETIGNVSNYRLGSGPNALAHLIGKEYPDGRKNFQFAGTSPGASRVMFGHNSGVLVENFEAELTGTPLTTSASMGVGPSVSLNSMPFYKNCRFKSPTGGEMLIGPGGLAVYKLTFQGCEFIATAPNAAVSVASSSILTNNGRRRVTLDSVRFIGYVPGSRLLPVGFAMSTENALVLRNCDLGDVRHFPTMLNLAGGSEAEGVKGVYSATQTGYRDFFYEDLGLLFIEWRFNAGRPTLNARLLDGVTPWSIYAVPTPVDGRVTNTRPVSFPRISKLLPSAADLPEAVRTITVNVLVDSTLSSWTRRELSALVSYVGTDDVLRTLDTFDPFGSALTNSTAPWSATDWNGQTWLRRRFTVTTPVPVKAGSEVVVYIRIHSGVSNDTQGVILCPDVQIT